MDQEIAPIPVRPWTLNGMSERLIVSHYENNYGGAVKRLNLITEQLAGLDFNTAPGFLINGLKREELIASNSMILARWASSLRRRWMLGSSSDPIRTTFLTEFGLRERRREMRRRL